VQVHAVLDGVHAVPDRGRAAVHALRVRAHPVAEPVCLVGDRGEFRVGELERIRVLKLVGPCPGRHHLDEVRARQGAGPVEQACVREPQWPRVRRRVSDKRGKPVHHAATIGPELPLVYAHRVADGGDGECGPRSPLGGGAWLPDPLGGRARGGRGAGESRALGQAGAGGFRGGGAGRTSYWVVRCGVVTLAPGTLRIALLSYRSKPHCGGQGVYVRHLSRELAALGHTVEVFSGQPYPELDPGPVLREVPSLDLYRDEDPFRTPRPEEYRDWVDLLETAMMWGGAFPEPLTFSIRARRALAARRGDFDVVHDNQGLGYGLLGLRRLGLPLVTSIHHPISVDRRIDLAGLHGLAKLSRRRWYGFVRMQARVARHAGPLITVSESSRDDICRDFRVRAADVHIIPLGVDTRVFRPGRDRVPG